MPSVARRARGRARSTTPPVHRATRDRATSVPAGAPRVIADATGVHVDGTGVGGWLPWDQRRARLPAALRDDWPVAARDVLELAADGTIEDVDLAGDGTPPALRAVLAAVGSRVGLCATRALPVHSTASPCSRRVSSSMREGPLRVGTRRSARPTTTTSHPPSLDATQAVADARAIMGRSEATLVVCARRTTTFATAVGVLAEARRAAARGATPALALTIAHAGSRRGHAAGASVAGRRLRAEAGTKGHASGIARSTFVASLAAAPFLNEPSQWAVPGSRAATPGTSSAPTAGCSDRGAPSGRCPPAGRSAGCRRRRRRSGSRRGTRPPARG